MAQRRRRQHKHGTLGRDQNARYWPTLKTYAALRKEPPAEVIAFWARRAR